MDRSRLVVSCEAAATLVAQLHHAHHVGHRRGAAAAPTIRQAARRRDGDAEQATRALAAALVLALLEATVGVRVGEPD